MAQLNQQPVASTGAEVAGGVRGVRIGGLGAAPTMADNGKMVFLAGLTGNGVTDATNVGLVRGGIDAGARPTLLARLGVRSSGLPIGLTGVSVHDLVTNASGAAAYIVTVVGPGVTASNNKLLMISDAMSTRMVARTGTRAPGLPAGTTLGEIASPQLAASGHLEFLTNFEGAGMLPGANRGVYVVNPGPGGVPVLVARQGARVAGMPAEVVWSQLGTPTLTASGLVLLMGFVEGGTVTEDNDAVVFSSGSGIVAREGGPAPGTSLKFGNFSLPCGSGSAVGFVADLHEGDGTDAGSGVFVSGGFGPPTLVAKTGGAESSMDADTVWLMFGQPSMAARGRVAFLANMSGDGVVAGANDVGLWAGDAGGVRQIARTGDEIPGIAGVRFATIEQPSVSATGHTVFVATLRGDGVTSGNDLGLFCHHRGTGLMLVARTGREVTVGGAVRTPVGLSIATGGDNRPTCLTRAGVLVYLLREAAGATIVRTTLPVSLADMSGIAGSGSDGVINRNDLAAFLAAFAAGSPLADVAGVSGPQRDGRVTPEDMTAFMAAYEGRTIAGVR